MSDTPSLSTIPAPVILTFRPGGNPEISVSMASWVKRIQDESPERITVERTLPESGIHPPSLTLPGAGRSEITYHFVPQGPEEQAFLEFLGAKLAGDPGPGMAEAPTASPSEPVEILLFVANECSNCPRAVRAVHALALAPAPPNLHVHLFEATLSPELAERHRVKAVPTLLIGDTFRLVGPPDPAKLSSLLLSGDADTLLREQIRQQIRWGEAPEAGRRIAEMPDPRFLIRDLEQSSFQERIGWLLALEEALDSRAGCLDPLVPDLVCLLEKAETALRGDLADLLGTIGDRQALPALERLRQDPNPDVAEAAADAIEQILDHARGSGPEEP